MSDRADLIKSTLTEIKIDLASGDLDAARARWDELLTELETNSEYAEEEE